MKNISIIICWLMTIVMLIMVNNTMTEFNNVIKNVEDNSQSLLIDTLYLEIMDLGARLDSMYIKYD